MPPTWPSSWNKSPCWSPCTAAKCWRAARSNLREVRDMAELPEIQATLDDLRLQQQAASDAARMARLTALTLREELARVERTAADGRLAQQIKRQIGTA